MNEAEVLAKGTFIVMDSLDLALKNLELANKMMPYSNLENKEDLQIRLLEGIQNLKGYIGDIKHE